MTDVRPVVSESVVLDVALTLFAERGFHGTALSQIAECLGIRTPSLYNHMRSKQDLLRAIVDETTATVLEEFHRATADGDWETRLREATRVYAYRHATHRREALVVNRDTDSLDEPHRSRLQSRRREHEHAFRAVIASGAAAGAFRVDSPALASFAIREMCVSIARWFREDGKLSAADVAEQYGRYALSIAGAQVS
ncbi:TetR/AcrR family transcriptional regulator [Amycolatopsis mongoliensis]|uniref:TetR/AcrR family transcriptional regulator n=1 Tax=Amycolatopsis mongoliensis TaxID=715475 RepID=A0A9Y2JND1_9PSEU|nr:TetR/AcrR family transcriptional regulator [Amycolatopsis sp. 4-36]WIY01208.1 TetR/AcrR family transcriptional regulator [Amycolatopsis sp. 4-36]